MQRNITYIMKCEFCGHLEECIMRDTNINSSLTDKDIRLIMSYESTSKPHYKYCEGCKLETLQKKVAWIGTH